YSTDEQGGARCDADGVVRAKAEQCPRGRACVQRVRHADGAERRVLQMRKLRQHERMQLRRKGEMRPPTRLSALPSGSAVAARLAPAKPKTRGFLHIVRHGAGPNAIYVVTYHRLGYGGPSALDNHPERKERASVPSASVSSTPHSSAQAGASATTAPPKPV